jgi:hypothetical protein
MPPPATFAGMIRLLLSALAFALFAAPVMAQDDDLPPLPTRAEVLAEIEALAAGPDLTVSALYDVLDVWEFEPSLAEASRRVAILMAERYSTELSENPGEPLSGNAVYRLVEHQLYGMAWDLYEQMIGVRENRPQSFHPNDQLNDINALYSVAQSLDRNDLAGFYSDELVEFETSRRFGRSEQEVLTNGAYRAFIRGDAARAERLLLRALAIIEVELEWTSEADQRVILDALEIQLHSGQSHWLQRIAALRERWGFAENDRFTYFARSAEQALSGSDHTLARRLVNEAIPFLSFTGYWDRESVLVAANVYARMGSCQVALQIVNYLDLQDQIAEAEIRLEDRITKSQRFEKQDFEEGDRIILVHRRWRAHELQGGRRAVIAERCQSVDRAAAILLDYAYGAYDTGFVHGVHEIEEAFESHETVRQLRISLGRQINLGVILPRMEAEFYGVSYPYELAYTSYLLRYANREEDADTVLRLRWPIFQNGSIESRDRLEALAWLALALPE